MKKKVAEIRHPLNINLVELFGSKLGLEPSVTEAVLSTHLQTDEHPPATEMKYNFDL